MPKKNQPLRLRRDNHTASTLTDHIVFSPKYRKPVLKGKIARACDEEIRRICRRLNVHVIDLAVTEDHVHLFIRYPPKLSPSVIAQRVKGVSSRRLRRRFPELRMWCPKGLWAPACYHGSVGQGVEVVSAYVRAQDPLRWDTRKR